MTLDVLFAGIIDRGFLSSSTNIIYTIRAMNGQEKNRLHYSALIDTIRQPRFLQYSCRVVLSSSGCSALRKAPSRLL